MSTIKVGNKLPLKAKMAQLVKNLPAIEDLVRSLGWEDPLKKGKATHSSILAWKTPWTGEPGGLQPIGWRRVRGG